MKTSFRSASLPLHQAKSLHNSATPSCGKVARKKTTPLAQNIRTPNFEKPVIKRNVVEYTWLRSLMGRYEDFWRVTENGLMFACQSLGLVPSQEKIDHLMRAYLALDPFSDVPAALDGLRGLPRSILSNGTPGMLDAVVRHASLEDRFEHVLSVDELRTYKPNPVVYRLAEDRLGIPREQIGFVSSNGWDVAGAKAFGFHAFWLNRNNSPVEVLGVVPDRIVHSAMELTSVVA